MSTKDFDGWNELKKTIDSKKLSICREREIWWCSLGINVGFEQDGTGNHYERPVVILRNINNATCFIVPLTTSSIDNAYRIPLGKIRGKNAWAATSQIRMIDSARLRNRVGKINIELFEKIRKSAKEIL